MSNEEDRDHWTPSTEQVRAHYVFNQSDEWDPERGEAFDRWLAAICTTSPAPDVQELIAEAREWPRDGINEGPLINALADALEAALGARG